MYLESDPDGYDQLKINNNCGKSPSALVFKKISFID